MKKLPLTLILILVFFIFSTEINSFKILAQEETEEDFELIAPRIGEEGEESSIFCTDFDVGYSGEKEGPFSSNSKPQDSEEQFGGYICGETEIKTESLGVPDFSSMENRLKLTLPKVLPLGLVDKAEIDSVDSQPLKSQARHYLIGQNGACLADSQEEGKIPIPRTEIESPSWWTQVIGQTKIFCGMLGSCEPPKKLKIKVEQLDAKQFEVDGESRNVFDLLDNEKDKLAVCPSKENSISEERPVFENKPEFKSCGLLERFVHFIISSITNLADNAGQLFEGKKVAGTESELTNKTRGYLPYGRDVKEQSSLFSSFIPEAIESSVKDSPLKTNVAYDFPKAAICDIDGNISEEGKILIDENEMDKASQMNYQEQNEVRMRYCLQICSLYPPDEKFNVNLIDPICISCDPKDYQDK